MTWEELLKKLDVVRGDLAEGKLICPDGVVQKLSLLRTELRVTHPKELLYGKIPPNDSLAASIEGAIAPYFKEPEPPPAPTIDPLLYTVPDEAVQTSKVQEIVPRADGEGRMVVMKRDTPLVVRPPDLVEVTEDEVAK